MTKKRYERAMAIFEEWKRDRYACAEKYQIPIALRVGQDPNVGALNSIAEHVLGSDGGWTVVETVSGDPMLLVKPEN